IVRIDFQTMTATLVAGSGTCVNGNSIGDGKTALEASLCHPESVGLDENNNLLIADNGHARVRRVIFSGNVAGSGLSYKPSAPDNSKLTRLSDGTFLRELRDGSKQYFDSQGKHTKTRGRLGTEILFAYDAQGRLVSQV